MSRGAGGSQTPDRLELLSVALPSSAEPNVTDSVTNARARSWGLRPTTINTAAVGTSGCDGCNAAAETVHLITVDWSRTVQSDNVAESQATGADANASALSIQVVLARRAKTVVVNNHASASTVNCTGCNSAAMAIQVVIVGARRTPSAQTRAELDDLKANAEQLLQRSAQPQARGMSPQTAGNDLASQIARVVTNDVGGTTQQQQVSFQAQS
ncbi:hypothetical protein [Microlunatus elymi]|uniref:hypothetical protein n=1 Tax=Microlunatus elymi TaxID=2596828 RepID=UPI00143DFAE0|nr:hypothetical protein [Microlunatus elymi]